MTTLFQFEDSFKCGPRMQPHFPNSKTALQRHRSWPDFFQMYPMTDKCDRVTVGGTSCDHQQMRRGQLRTHPDIFRRLDRHITALGSGFPGPRRTAFADCVTPGHPKAIGPEPEHMCVERTVAPNTRETSQD